MTQNDNKSTDALEKNGEKSSNERDGGDRVEAVKFLKPPNLFSAAANAFLVSECPSFLQPPSLWQRILAVYILRRNKPSHFCHWFLCRHYTEILIPFLHLRRPSTPIPISISSLAEEEGGLLRKSVRYELRTVATYIGWSRD